MKPPSFQYLRPASLSEAKLMLKQHRDDCKILAGGQSLVPLLNFRLAVPAVVIDINEISELNFIASNDEGLTLGALARWHQIETSEQVVLANPLLAEAVRHIAHYQIRNRGTWAGSCVHADPAAEFPAVTLACGAELKVVSVDGERIIDPEDFFVEALTTNIEPHEILAAVRFPPWSIERRWAFEEFSIRRGDFALAGIVAVVDMHEVHDNCRLVSFGVGSRQTRLRKAEQMIMSAGLTGNAIARAAQAAANEVDAQDDIHATADYRRALIEELSSRALRRITGIGADR